MTENHEKYCVFPQQLSQFWYNEETKTTLAKVCLKLILNRAGNCSASDVKIGILSCPSLCKSVRIVIIIHPNGVVNLFEFDNRLAAFKDDFVHYDYKRAATEPEYLQQFAGYIDIIIVDPPFLSEECIDAY